jgi:hypothetical protein
MKHQLLFAVLLFCIISSAQTKLNFGYDGAGNQKTRTLCINCPPNSAKTSKEIEDLTEQDLEKLSEQDVISFYPNPVKEELYLQWELPNENYIASIQIFSINGQLLKQYVATNKTNNQNIPFQNYPSGVYAVLLKYNNGEEKSIKIIKQ